MASAVDKTSEAISEAEWEKINRGLTSIHRGSGHSSKASLLLALRRQGASKKVMTVAAHFKCDACLEAKQQTPTQPPVSLTAIPAKWKHIQADQFEWRNLHTKVKSKCALILGENCRMRVSKLFYHMVGDDQRRGTAWGDLNSFYEERWLPYFGKPREIKADPTGPGMDEQAAGYFDSDSIASKPIPEQAHRHTSLVEEAVQVTKRTMDRLIAENHGEDVRGHSWKDTGLGRPFLRE